MCSCLMSSEPIPKEERASLPFDRDNELVSLTVDVLDLDAWVAVKHTAQLGHIEPAGSEIPQMTLSAWLRSRV